MSAASERSPNPPVYDGLRVVELADDPAAEYTGRLLAEMGALVIKVEPPAGAASRRIGPFAGGLDDGEHSLHFWFYNADKHSVRIDLGDAAGTRQFESLIASADVFICGLQPQALAAAGLSLERLAAGHPALIIAAITPFGLTGPWKDHKASDLVLLAAGGPLHMCGYDDHSIPPIRPGGNQGYHTGTAFAHIGLLLALLERQRTGKGQIVDLSNQAALAVTVELANPYWHYPRALVLRQTCRHAQPVMTQPALFQCADGYVYFALILTETKPWQVLVEWLKSHDLGCGLDEPAFLDPAYRQSNFDQIQQVVEAFFLMNKAEDMYREGQQRGLPVGTLNAPEDLFHDRHLRAREFFVPVEHPGTGAVEYPGSAYRFSAFSSLPPRPAPRLGEADVQFGAPDARVERR
ncbi:MAG: CaiB/BaiF CoA transferase family protein [Dehalococcoidia bacterium]